MSTVPPTTISPLISTPPSLAVTPVSVYVAGFVEVLTSTFIIPVGVIVIMGGVISHDVKLVTSPLLSTWKELLPSEKYKLAPTNTVLASPSVV